MSAPDVLDRTMQRAGISRPTTSMQINLHTMIKDKTAERLPSRGGHAGGSWTIRAAVSRSWHGPPFRR
jgi:hypothetical protein